MGRDEQLPDEAGQTRRLPGPHVPVWLAQRLQRVRVPSREIAGARGRVAERVFANMPHGVSRAASKRLRRRLALAMTLATLVAVGWLTALAENALPSSPLYAVKRGEEWVAYQTAWSPARRGDMLLMAANRRLDEAQTVAEEQGDAAVDLALEVRANLLELIGLYHRMNVTQAPAGQVQSIEAGLSRMLEHQSAAANAAEDAGWWALAATLRENTRVTRGALAIRHLVLP